MSQEQRNKNWRPVASLVDLTVRAQLLADIRHFFRERAVLEVETPLMCRSATTDPFLSPIPVLFSSPSGKQETFYLQTSPEFAMKRLLAAGCGPIYQISKAFRNAEVGRLHNPEFSMLEWYQPGFDHHQLMDEIAELLQAILGVQHIQRVTYGDLFKDKLEVDPHLANISELRALSLSQGISLEPSTMDSLSFSDWLDLLMTHCIEPTLGFPDPVFVFDYPVCMAALAKIRMGDVPVAERFEVYVKGLELANGYHELTDPKLQLERFVKDCEVREQLGLPRIPVDMQLIQALESGLPSSAGVALGLDRLLMLKLGKFDIQNVIAFTIDQV